MTMPRTLLLALLMLINVSAHAEEILIAAAADLKFAMDEVVKEFKTKNPTEKSM